MKNIKYENGNLAKLLPKFLKTTPTSENLKKIDQFISSSEKAGFIVLQDVGSKRVEIQYSNQLILRLLKKSFYSVKDEKCFGELNFNTIFDLLFSAGLHMLHEKIITYGFDDVAKYPSESVKKTKQILDQLIKIQTTIFNLHNSNERVLPNKHYINLQKSADSLMESSEMINRTLSSYEKGQQAKSILRSINATSPKVKIGQLVQALEDDLRNQNNKIQIFTNSAKRLVDKSRAKNQGKREVKKSHRL